jgi:hypothetical protein
VEDGTEDLMYVVGVRALEASNRDATQITDATQIARKVELCRAVLGCGGTGGRSLHQ